MHSSLFTKNVVVRVVALEQHLRSRSFCHHTAQDAYLLLGVVVGDGAGVTLYMSSRFFQVSPSRTTDFYRTSVRHKNRVLRNPYLSHPLVSVQKPQ
jgi:hypothetical protein